MNVRTVAAVALLALAAGCAPEPVEGEITDLEHHGSWVQQICTRSGTVTTCTPIYHDDCYEVEYKNGDENGSDCADPALWATLEVGDWYRSDA